MKQLPWLYETVWVSNRLDQEKTMIIRVLPDPGTLDFEEI
jgi:hypothetical protein